jgi:hypothetical protein
MSAFLLFWKKCLRVKHQIFFSTKRPVLKQLAAPEDRKNRFEPFKDKCSTPAINQMNRTSKTTSPLTTADK